ncbi:MAG: hypothetical protein P8Z37_04980 [Acidobacteriota bacterium]
MKSKITNIVLLSLMLPLVSFAAYADEDREESLQLKIQQLEQKLKSVEEALKTKTNSQSSPVSSEDRKEQIEELHRQIGILAEEVEKLRSGEQEVEITSEQAASMGLGPSAAKVYQKRQGVSIAGYGEMLYENFSDETQSGMDANKTSQLDFLRAILYTGYRFNDRFVLNSEIEFEHASTGKGGEVSVEFAYLEYMANNHLNVRGGLLLIPMGLTNEYHEPVAFLGARRSETESQIIPTTWREGGVGVLGSAGIFSYRAYLVNGMDATGYGASGIRGGRQKGAKAKAEDFAFVGRVDVNPSPGMIFGGSLYIGGAGQGQIMESSQNYNVRTTIGEVHVQFGYNVLSQHMDRLRLTPYYRFEKLNTQSRVPEGYDKDPARDREIHTAGLEFRPITNIVIKGEHQWNRNQAGTGINQFNINLGYNF